jgi:hypothetical protein
MNSHRKTETKLNRTAALIVACAAIAPATFANERFFTYSYEPETMPQGALEIEQWVTARALRNTRVGQDDYLRWQFRTELEYGVTDNYTVGLYVNEDYETFKNPATGRHTRDFSWAGISLENRYMVLNPATKPVGLTLYLEPTYDGEDFELEQKIIIGQRHGDWKWAFNAIHATEWEEDFEEYEGEVEFTFGVTRILGKNWAVGLEARNHNELPEYHEWENSALYLGPVVTYRRESFWATLTVLPQIWGDNFHGSDPDGNHGLELEGHERWNIRLIAGYSF